MQYLYLPIDNSIVPPKLRTTELLPIIVFLAFSIEAYLNEVGYRKVPKWDEIERRASWKTKVRRIHEAAGVLIDWNSESLKFVSQAFELRDKLAHGKPEQVTGPSFDTEAEARSHAFEWEELPAWLESVETLWVMQARDRFRVFVEDLAMLSGLSSNDYLSGYAIRMERFE